MYDYDETSDASVQIKIEEGMRNIQLEMEMFSFGLRPLEVLWIVVLSSFEPISSMEQSMSGWGGFHAIRHFIGDGK